MKDWYTCSSCDEEFRVISIQQITYCPICGSELNESEEDEEKDEWSDE